MTVSVPAVEAHVRRIAAEPRPTGSAHHRAVREYLVAVLTGLGYDVTAEPVLASADTGRGQVEAGIVHNVRATPPGGGPGVLLVAHYDSVARGPGANDDALAVAVALEIARIRPVEILFTDGEEVGLLGARIEATPARMVNLEARGSSGPVVMFETSRGSRGLIGGAGPPATSVGGTVYRRLPNDTDFSIMRRAGYTGLNFAVIDSSADYHTALDSPAHVRRSVIADLAATAERALDHLATAPDDAREAAYFPLLGRLVSYPARYERLVAAAGLAVLAARPPRPALAGLIAVPVLASAATAAGAWWAALRIRPHYAGFALGDPYRPGPMRAGITAVAAGLSCAWVARLRTRYTPAEITAAAQSWCAVGGAALAVAAPATAHVATWPAALGRTPLGLATPAVALAAPLVRLLYPAFGLRGAAVPAALASYAALTAAVAGDRRVLRVAATALIAGGAALWLGGVRRDRTDADHPAQVSLLYVARPDEGRAFWLSADRRPGTWLRGLVPDGPVAAARALPILRRARYRHGPAPAWTGAAPTARLVARRPDGTVVLRVDSGGDGDETMLSVVVSAPGGEVSLLCPAEAPTRPAPGLAERRLAVAAPPSGGLDILVRASGAGVEVTVIRHVDLPEKLLVEPRPADVAWSARSSGHGYVVRTYRLDSRPATAIGESS